MRRLLAVAALLALATSIGLAGSADRSAAGPLPPGTARILYSSDWSGTSEIYAVDPEHHWQGAVSLDTLLRARRPVPLSDLIEEDRRRVSVLDDQEEVARMFGKYNLVAAPVVDTTNRLVGVIKAQLAPHYPRNQCPYKRILII